MTLDCTQNHFCSPVLEEFGMKNHDNLHSEHGYTCNCSKLINFRMMKFEEIHSVPFILSDIREASVWKKTGMNNFEPGNM